MDSASYWINLIFITGIWIGLLWLVIEEIVSWPWPWPRPWPRPWQEAARALSSQKTFYFHRKEINNGCEEVITGAYQLDVESGLCRFAGSSYSRRTKAIIQKLIDDLDPLSLEYLKEKERFEKEMNNPKSWRRDEHIEKASIRLTDRPFVLDFGKRCGLREGERLDYHRYRSLEKFIGDCLKVYGMYRLSNGSNDPMNNGEFLARLPHHTKAVFDIGSGAVTETPTKAEEGAEEGAGAEDETEEGDEVQDADILFSFFVIGFIILGLVRLEPNSM